MLVGTFYCYIVGVEIETVKFFRVIIKEIDTCFRVRENLLYCVRKKSDMTRPGYKSHIRETIQRVEADILCNAPSEGD